MRGLTKNISRSENMEQNKTLSSYAARKGKETDSPSDFCDPVRRTIGTR